MEMHEERALSVDNTILLADASTKFLTLVISMPYHQRTNMIQSIGRYDQIIVTTERILLPQMKGSFIT